MSVTAWSPNLTAERARAMNVQFSPSLPALLERTDVLTVHLRLTPLSRGLIGARELNSLPSGAYFVNTARAAIADESALLAALDSGHLAGAALDVFGEEPLPVDSPIRHHAKILATSHMGYVSQANYREFYGQALQDVIAFLSGRPIRVLGSK
jgi:phosphoglycerate dehydrogenase-like enzyme